MTSNFNHIIFEIRSVISEPEDEHDTWTKEGEWTVISDTEPGSTTWSNSAPLNLENSPDVGGEMCIPANPLTSKHDLTIILSKTMDIHSSSLH